MLHIDGDYEAMAPPPLPTNHVYTSCYCEENIYLLAQKFSTTSINERMRDQEGLGLWDKHVVFVSNDQKTVSVVSESVLQAGLRFVLRGALNCVYTI